MLLGPVPLGPNIWECSPRQPSPRTCSRLAPRVRHAGLSGRYNRAGLVCSVSCSPALFDCPIASITALSVLAATPGTFWPTLPSQAAGSPIGAALLTHMDPRTVEGVMAAVLLLVILVHVKLPARAAAAVRGWRQRRR